MIKVIVAGDFVASERVADQLNGSDFGCISNVKNIFRNADYAIANLEAPVIERTAKPIQKTGPNLKCKKVVVDCLVEAGLSCVTLANNHFRDYGQLGVEETIEACIESNLDFVGGGRNEAEAQRILYKEINGQSLAIINFCENEFSIYTNEYGGSNPLNPIRNYYDICDARSKADYVLVIVHGGHEHWQYPSPRMQECYRFFIDSGADAVVNHHQHCFSGYEIYKKKPIFYGLGNFCYDRKESDSLWQQGFFVSISFGIKDSFTIYPYTQGTKDYSGVLLLEDKEKERFFEKLNHINEVIDSPELLMIKYNELISQISINRLLELEPVRNKFIAALQVRGFLPSFISKKTKLDIYDSIKCESHREILVEALSRVLDKE